MPRVSRRRVLDASVSAVWEVISDPHHLPRWWPRVSRVESVHEVRGGRRSQWTAVLDTKGGRGVRADYRCTASAERKHYAWEQELDDSPFERILRHSSVEIGLEPADGATEVRLTAEQRLRGLSRLGSPMMRGAQRRILESALDGLEGILPGGGGGEDAGG